VKHVGPKRRPSGRTDKSFDINHAVAEMLQLLRRELQMQGCDDEAVGAAASRIVTANQKDSTTVPAWHLALGLEDIAATLSREHWRRHTKDLKRVVLAGIEYHRRQRATLEQICDAMSKMPLSPNSPLRPSWEKRKSALRSMAESHLDSPLESRETLLALQEPQNAEPSVGLKEERALLRDRLFRTFVACGLPDRNIAMIMNRDSRGASEVELNKIIRRTRVRLSMLKE
jgi:hypothetical protein